jgi:hypothetical protein
MCRARELRIGLDCAQRRHESMLNALEPGEALAHHSFHVFAVYPWVRFLDRGPTKPVQVMQDCRVRWGTVQSVQGDHAVIDSQPLTFADGRLGSAIPPTRGAVAQGRHLPGAGTVAGADGDSPLGLVVRNPG